MYQFSNQIIHWMAERGKQVSYQLPFLLTRGKMLGKFQWWSIRDY